MKLGDVLSLACGSDSSLNISITTDLIFGMNAARQYIAEYFRHDISRFRHECRGRGKPASLPLLADST